MNFYILIPILLSIFININIALADNTLQERKIDSLKSELTQFETDTNRVLLYHQICNVFKDSNLDSCKVYADSTMNLAKKINWKKGIAIGNKCFGVYNALLGDLDESLNYFKQSLQEFEIINDIKGISQSNLSISRVYKMKGDFDIAMEFANKAHNINKKNDMPTDLIQSYTSIGTIYSKLKYYDEALTNYKEAYQLSKKINDTLHLEQSLNNLGIVNFYNKNYDKALEYYTESLELNVSQTSKARLFINIALVHKESKRFDLAIQYLEKAKIISKQIKSKRFISYVYINLSDLYHYYANNINDTKKQTQLYKKAKLLAEEAIKLSKEIDLRENILDYYTINANATYELGDYKDAFIILSLHNKIKDSLDEASNLNKLKAIELKYQDKLHKKEIAEKELELSQSKLQTYLLLLLILFVITITILLYSRQKSLKKANNKIEEKVKELNEANTTKDKFFSIIAHDLKNPIAGFRDITKVLSDNYDDFDDAEFKEYVKDLSISSKGIFDLLENLLTWSRAQTGNINHQPTNANLHFITKTTFDALNSQANAKGIKLINNIDTNLELFCDVNMINTIIRNLCSNSIKFSKEGTEIKAYNIKNKTNGYETIVLEDQGIGMTQKTIDKLFKIDESIISEGTKGEGGTGLGLILCKEFILQNNGEIWVESQLNKGSKFMFSLPKYEIN